MSFNGSGLYIRDNGDFTGSTVWEQDDNGGFNIDADRHDVHDQNIADGLSNVICKDGQSTPTANIPFGGFRLTNVGAGTSRTDAARISQLQDGGPLWAGATAGSATVMTASLTPAITAYVAGLKIIVKSGFTTTGATTLNVNGVGAVDVRIGASGSIPLTSGSMAAGEYYELVHDGTFWILINPSPFTAYRDLNSVVTVNTTTAESTLFTGTLPGGLISAGRVLRFMGFGDLKNTTGSAVDFTFRAKLGATTFHASDTISINTATNRGCMRFYWEIWNRNSESSQHSFGHLLLSGFGTEATAGTMRADSSQSQHGTNAGAVNTGSDNTIALTGQFGTSSVNAEMRWYKTMWSVI